MDILPKLKSSLFTDGKLKIGEVSIIYGKFETYCGNAFLCRTELENKNGTKIYLEKDSTFKEEEYSLLISNGGIKIMASDEKGVIQAFTTIYKLMKGNLLPFAEIHDGPLYSHRGISLDCSRHFYPAYEVKKIIEGMSLFKLNKLHWHLSDDQGFRIELEKHPEVNKTEYYTKDEIKDIVSYAKERGVDVIPEVDMPGHVSAVLSSHPEFGCFNKKVEIATKGGIYPIIFCSGKESVFSFIEDLIGEMAELFPSPIYHIGGDEAPKKEWESCPDCKKIRDEFHISTLEDQQGYFTKKVNGILKKYGKEPICWNETLLAKNLDFYPTIQYWTLNYRKEMEEAVNKGCRWIYSDMFELYFDYPYSMTSLKKVFETRAHLGKSFITNNLDGYECCLWSERIKDNNRLEELLFPRAAAVAEIAWSDGKDYDLFEKTLTEEIPLLEKAELHITPPSWWNPKGKARRKEAIDFFIQMNSGIENKEETKEASKPNKEFASAFMSKFFKKSDLPALLPAMMKGNK